MPVVLLVLGILLFIGLVLAHEWGHYITARKGGVEVEEFGLFFPPRLKVLKKRHGTEFTLNLLPLGGFVKLKGEHDADTAKGSFGAAPLSTKVKIMTAGVVMNLLVAIGMFGILALIGMPRLVDNQFVIKSDNHIVQQKVLAGYVDDSSPAKKAGLQARDTIKSFTSEGRTTTIKTKDQVRAFTKAHAGKSITINAERKGKPVTLTPTLLSEKEVQASLETDNPKGYLGMIPNEFVVQRATWSAPIVAVGTAVQYTTLTFKGLGQAVSGLGSIIAGTTTRNTEARQNGQTKASEQVSGPVGIFVVLRDGSLLGIRYTLVIIAIVSLTLAIMNILPIPALDGGRLYVTLLFHKLKKPLTPQLEDRIHGTGFVALIGLFFVITVVDVRRFF